MSRLPQLSGIELIKILGKIGFKVKRQHGSHFFLEHEDGRTKTVPNHPREELDRRLLQKIIKKDVLISKEEFEKLI